MKYTIEQHVTVEQAMDMGLELCYFFLDDVTFQLDKLEGETREYAEMTIDNYNAAIAKLYEINDSNN